MRAIGTLFALIIIFGGILASGPIVNFIDIPSILFVLGPVIGAVISRHGFSGFKGIFKPDESVEIYRTIGTSAVLSGVLGSLVGIVLMLENISDASAIGPAMAVSILTAIYGIGIYLFCLIINKKIEYTNLSVFLPVGFVGLSVLSVFVLLLSFTKNT